MTHFLQYYLAPIFSALRVFPFVAALITLPYIFWQYRKYGAILAIRTIIVYSFVFYMMTSWFMTILPLPDIDSVGPDSATVLLKPFDAVSRACASGGVQLNTPSTWMGIIATFEFWQIMFNIALLVPFGVYLRYYFKRKWYEVLLLSFLYSLFFEVTQLSGLYGIYPYPYRYFEVDDLIANTLGGMVGFLITPIFGFLPSRDKLDSVAHKRGERVSSFRRFFATCFDCILIAMLVLLGYTYLGVSDILPYRYLSAVITVLSAVVITIVEFVFGGRSVGKFIVSIKVVNSATGAKPGLGRLFERNVLLQIGFFGIQEAMVVITKLVDFEHLESTKNYFLSAGLIICSLILILETMSILKHVINVKHPVFHDRLSGTDIVGTNK